MRRQDLPETTFCVGDRVFFWSGRGSQGHATIREIRDGRAFLDPDPDAIKGSDFRTYTEGARKANGWSPRDHGVRFTQINTPPRPWFEDN